MQSQLSGNDQFSGNLARSLSGNQRRSILNKKPEKEQDDQPMLAKFLHGTVPARKQKKKTAWRRLFKQTKDDSKAIKKYTPDPNEIRITVKPVGKPEFDIPFIRKSAEQPAELTQSNGQLSKLKPGQIINIMLPHTIGQPMPPTYSVGHSVPLLIHKQCYQSNAKEPTAPRVDILAQACFGAGELN